MLKRPGIPFDADVSLLVLSYLIVGYILKDRIVDLFQRQSLKLDVIAIGVIGLLILEHLLMEKYGVSRQIDMKLVVYKNPIEQNRCAMACQGCGAVLFLLKSSGSTFHNPFLFSYHTKQLN